MTALTFEHFGYFIFVIQSHHVGWSQVLIRFHCHLWSAWYSQTYWSRWSFVNSFVVWLLQIL